MTSSPVSWDGAPDLSALAGQPIRLRFVIKDADLYSMRLQIDLARVLLAASQDWDKTDPPPQALHFVQGDRLCRSG